MMPLLLQHLEALVAFDTQNPPRAISSSGGIFDYLRAALPGFTFELCDHGAGAVSLLAVRGQPKLLFNVHVDTVPASPAWTANPLRLRLSEDRAIGLGACDIKGAAAALLSAAAQSTGAAAILFSSDEEANDARCIQAFLKKPRRFDAAIIAEPTRAEAVLAHRGIAAARLIFRGRAGHASAALADTDSALHHAVQWGHAALALSASFQSERFGGLTGLRFNIGRIEGGIKANVIAPSAELRFGFRPLPSQSQDALHAAFRGLVADAALESYEETFRGPSLPTGELAEADESMDGRGRAASGTAAESARLCARDLADALALPIGSAVDFWTEAALFSAAGMTALVYGPGDIAQAHSADEWVALSQLAAVATNYRSIIDHDNA